MARVTQSNGRDVSEISILTNDANASMNHTFRIVSLALLSLGALATSSAVGADRVLFADKFSSPLDSSWSWLREDPQDWKIEDGALRILALPGHVFKQHNDARNVLLRNLPETSRPVVVEVYVESWPKVMFEEASLYWWYDEDNFVCVTLERLENELHVRMYREVEGKPEFVRFKNPCEVNGISLRLVVQDGKAAGYQREAGQAGWRSLGQCDLPAKGPAKIALNAGGGGKNTENWARFSQFRILELGE